MLSASSLSVYSNTAVISTGRRILKELETIYKVASYLSYISRNLEGLLV